MVAGFESRNSIELLLNGLLEQLRILRLNLLLILWLNTRVTALAGATGVFEI